jgi:hypothetical protein
MPSRRVWLACVGAGFLPCGRRSWNCQPPAQVQKPELKPAPVFWQPDYKAWKEIREGMTKANVVRILGDPLHRRDEDEVTRELNRKKGLNLRIRPPEERVDLWTFGRLDFASPTIPGKYEFYVVFKGGKVERFTDPFQGDFSLDGTPSVPRLLSPHDGSSFDHYPRFVDFRWQPPSGVYPMEFTIDVRYMTHAKATEDDVEYDDHAFGQLALITTSVPHASHAHVMGPGIWRIKAKNRLGASDWSEFRRFEFTE